MPQYVVPADYSQQYQRIANSRTGIDRALDVGAIADLSAGVDNFAQYVHRRVVIAQPFIPGLYCPADVAERLILPPLAPRRRINDNHTMLNAYISHGRNTDSGQVVWTLYASNKLYRGPRDFDASYLSPNYVSVNWTSTSTTDIIERKSVSIAELDPDIYLLFTADSDATGTGTVSFMMVYYG